MHRLIARLKKTAHRVVRLFHTVRCHAIKSKYLLTGLAFSLFLVSSPSISTEAGVLRSIGISVADLGNPYFVKLVESTASKAKELSPTPVKMHIRSDAYDLERQTEQLNQFIDEGVDLIVLTAADEYGVAPVVAKARRAGIKVIAVDVNAEGADATITTDNVQAGRIACEHLAERINHKGNFVIINGVSVSSVVERVAGCKSAISRYPDITLLSDRLNGTGSLEGGMEAMTYLMEAYDHIDAVFTINDPTALGAIQAAEQAKRGEFILASVDGAEFAKRYIDKSDIWIGTATQQPVQMAEKAVEIGLDLLNGKQIEQKFILIPSEFYEATPN
ncbi:substrate-binding domain-containing protein [Marinomonas mediterranea]|uniref:substrate-binding domain-containing protein n=1 Tax=Marinomonas mediterranea TaxID=119864 RepID=UPI002349D418|nr:substrate-binding domain-containing protein [Marinomonas mediterranea]WCN15140.1 substrate-binding domain-containing protein [Marinomonas mediterranea]